MRTLIPPGHARQVAEWDEEALTYQPTGQRCPRFGFDGLLQPGQDILLGDLPWQVHAAPGHDPHSVILFEPASRTLVSADALWENGFGVIFPELEGEQAWQVHAAPGHDPHSVVLFEAHSRTLISADALWENGFGVVFPEIEGEQAFDEVAATLDLIEQLQPATVVPGHGPVFSMRAEVMERARQRLAGFQTDPQRHAQHAAKVLLKFKLLEVQKQPREAFISWARNTPYLGLVHQRFFAEQALEDWLSQLLAGLAKVGAAELDEGWVLNR